MNGHSQAARKRLRDMSKEVVVYDLFDTTCTQTPPSAWISDVISYQSKPRGKRRSSRKENAPIHSSPIDKHASEEKKCSRIGVRYQAYVPPFSDEDEPVPSEGDVLWRNPSSRSSPLDFARIENFLDQSSELCIRVLLLQALNDTEFDVERARTRFFQLHSESNSSIIMSKVQEVKFRDMCNGTTIGLRKEMNDAAKMLKTSLSTVLVHYYRWKAGQKEEYDAMKRKRRELPMECFVCGDGGNMILCDACHCPFHLQCLKPPLTKVPEGDWFCPRCTEMNAWSYLRYSSPLNSPEKKKKLIASRLSPSQKAIAKSLRCIEPPLSTGVQKQLASNNQREVIGAAIEKRKDPPSQTEQSTQLKSMQNFKTADTANNSQTAANTTHYVSQAQVATRPQVQVHTQISQIKPINEYTPLFDAIDGAVLNITLPIVPGGFGMNLTYFRVRGKSQLFFLKHNLVYNKKSFAEKHNLLYYFDEFVAIDNVSCMDKSYEELLSMIHSPTSNRTKKFRVLRRSTKEKENMERSLLALETDDVFGVLTVELPIRPEGFLVRIYQQDGGVCVRGFNKRNGVYGPAATILREGDQIDAVDGVACENISEVVQLMKESNGTSFKVVTIRRRIDKQQKDVVNK